MISFRANTIKSDSTLEELRKVVCWWDQNIGPMPHREPARATGVTFEELGR